MLQLLASLLLISEEADLDIRFFRKVYRIDKTHASLGAGHNDGLDPDSLAKEPDAMKQTPFGHPRSRKDDLLSRREFAGRIDPLRILDPH